MLSFFFKCFFPDFCNPFSITQCQFLLSRILCTTCAYWHGRHLSILGEPRLQPCFPPRHDPSASRFLSHDRGDFHSGKHSAWEESRYPPQFHSLPLCALLASWRRYSAHDLHTFVNWGLIQEPPGGTGRACTGRAFCVEFACPPRYKLISDKSLKMISGCTSNLKTISVTGIYIR